MDNDFSKDLGGDYSFLCLLHNVIGDKVELPFVEFAKLCGIPSSQSSRRLRERISPSLKRIAVISFSRTDEKHTRELSIWYSQPTGPDRADIVQLQADPRLFELYQFDRKVLLQLKAINSLDGARQAPDLYREPAPDRYHIAGAAARTLTLQSWFSHNQTVRRAMEQLREIGYLDYTEIQRGRQKPSAFTTGRLVKILNDESKENPLPPSTAEKVSPAVVALLESASRWMTWKNSSNKL